MTVCEYCGELSDLPWGACLMCTGVRLDISRHPDFRLNPRAVLLAHAEKMHNYDSFLTPAEYIAIV